MTKKRFGLELLAFSLLFSSVIYLLSSCRKIESSFESGAVSNINYEEKFFTIPAGTKPAVIRVINKIKEQNNQYHFVNDFVKKHGFPKWEFADVEPAKRKSKSYARDENSSDTFVIIPVANEVLEKIKSVLACNVEDTEVAIQLIKDYTYKYYGYEPNPEGKATAKDIAAMFMKFEYKVYNRRIFEVPDVELAKKMLGNEWEDQLTHLILKEDPLTNEIGFYRTICVLVVPGQPNVIDLPPVIITHRPGIEPIFFPTPGFGIGSGIGWWLNGLEPGSDPGAGGGANGNPSNGPGSGTTGSPGSSSGTTGGNQQEDPGWEEPECGGHWEGEKYFRQICPDSIGPVSSVYDSIPNILSRACDKQMDSLYQWGMSNGFREQSFILVVKDSIIYPKNFLPGFRSGDKTRVNYSLDRGEELLGYVHIHAEDTVNFFRTSFSPDDLIEFNKHGDKLGYTAIVEVGNNRYAFVVEDVTKKTNFNISKRGNHDNLYKAILDVLTSQFSNGQYCTEQAWIQYIGSSTTSGIGFYKSTVPNKNTFTKLNP